jgi:hypothetical protein
MDKPIWQSKIVKAERGYGINILLDRAYAESMIKTILNQERQNNMNKVGSSRLETFGIKCLTPYTFYKNTALISSVDLGSDGRWISAESSTIETLLDGSANKIEYHDHNLDSANDVLALMSIFGLWVDYSEIFRDL